MPKAPLKMNDTNLTSHINAVVDEIASNLGGSSPFLANEVLRWIRQISPGGDPSAHFLHVRMFPILRLPEYLLESLSVARDDGFQQSLISSTVHGYYYIRLIDDVVDRDRDLQLELSILPVAGYFCSQFQFSYQRYFSAEDAFWTEFRRLWTVSAGCSAEDASLPAVGWADFERVASRKYSAAGIPVAATCLYYSRSDVLASWLELVHAMGRWSQMVDDILDWHADSSIHRATYFLSEGEQRKRPRESLDEWVLREGCVWGFDLLNGWMDQLQQSARQLGSPGLCEYLDRRRAWLQHQRSALLNGLSALADLASILGQAESPAKFS